MALEPLRNTEAELDAFFATCERLAGFDRALTAFFVDGWLTAMAAGPVRLPAEQWLELLCEDTFERAFADPPDREHALATLNTRLIALHDMLDAEALFDRPDTLRLEPLFDVWSDEDRQQMRERGVPEEAVRLAFDGELWAQGFLAGASQLREAAWQLRLPDDAEDEYSRLTSQVEALTLDPQGEVWREFVREFHQGKEPDRERLLDDAAFAVQDLRLFLLEFGPRPATRRVEARPGRNDPCPCGSGKKYKKCHGALEAG